jgi:hypothetical protein
MQLTKKSFSVHSDENTDLQIALSEKIVEIKIFLKMTAL